MMRLNQVEILQFSFMRGIERKQIKKEHSARVLAANKTKTPTQKQSDSPIVLQKGSLTSFTQSSLPKYESWAPGWKQLKLEAKMAESLFAK